MILVRVVRRRTCYFNPIAAFAMMNALTTVGPQLHDGAVARMLSGSLLR